MKNSIEQKNKIYKLVMFAALLALTLVGGFIEIPYGTIMGLKFDFSDMILLISMFVLGYRNSLLILVCRFLLRFLIIAIQSYGLVAGIFAEGVAVIASLTILSLVYLFSKLFKFKNKYINMIFIVLLASILFSLVMTVLNFFFITPLFLSVYGLGNFSIWNFKIALDRELFSSFGVNNLSSYTKLILGTYIPFNLIKGVFSILICLLVKPNIEKLITKETSLKDKKEDDIDEEA